MLVFGFGWASVRGYHQPLWELLCVPEVELGREAAAREKNVFEGY